MTIRSNLPFLEASIIVPTASPIVRNVSTWTSSVLALASASAKMFAPASAETSTTSGVVSVRAYSFGRETTRAVYAWSNVIFPSNFLAI